MGRFSNPGPHSNSHPRVNHSLPLARISNLHPTPNNLLQDHFNPKVDNNLFLNNQDLPSSFSQGHMLECLTRLELLSIPQHVSHPNKFHSPRGNTQHQHLQHQQAFHHQSLDL